MKGKGQGRKYRALVNCSCRRCQSIITICLASEWTGRQLDRNLIRELKSEKRMTE